MAGITLDQAEAQLALWLAASTAVSAKQRYKIGERELWLTDAAEIRNNIDYWNAKVVSLTASVTGRGRARTMRVR
jgi:hypothetical protein